MEALTAHERSQKKVVDPAERDAKKKRRKNGGGLR